MNRSGLRVAHVVCTDAFAGVERYVVTLTEGLARRGADVTVVGGAPARMQAALETAGARWQPGPDLASAWRRLIGLSRVDIVHAHMTAAELAAITAGPWHQAPVVATRHFAQRRGSSLPARLVGSAITRRLASQLAISKFVADSTEGPCKVVMPGTPPQPEAPPAERRPVVLVAQRLEPEKRTDLALRVWQRSGLATEGWLLEVAGDGRERQRLADLAEQLGVADSCRWLGARDDMESLQRQASVLLAPRPDEPLGLSVIEAMAAGLPVVAAAGGGHLETVGRHPGAALYPPHDLDTGGRLLADLAKDAGRREAYGKELRALHEREFSIDRQVQAVLDVYRQILR